MSRARDLGSLINSAAAGKNFIINGAFDIWQRGTSIAAASTVNVYTADRWMIGASGASGSSVTISRQATGDTTNLPSIQYCTRVQRNSGQTGTAIATYSQSIETLNSIPFVGKTVTISFYARRGANYSPTGNVLGLTLYSGTATDGNIQTGPWTGIAGVANTSATLTTTWQRFTATGTVSASATQLGIYFYWTPTGTAGANDYFEVTGVQLEIGSSSTTFSRAGGDIQGELSKCQRYYYRAISESLYGPIGTGKAYSTSILNINIPLPVKMRSIASITSGDLSALSTFQFETGASAGTTPTSIAVNPNLNSSTYASVDLVKTSAFTTGSFYYLMGSNSTNSFIGFSSEL